MDIIKKIRSKISKNVNGVAFLIFLIHLSITFFTDSIIFTVEHYEKGIKYTVIKLIATVCLFIFWQFIFRLYKGIKENHLNTKRYVKYLLIYFITMLIFLLLTWPGIWRSDEVNILRIVRNLGFVYWHHWLTDAYYIFSLCIIPFPAGIIIIQIIIISIIVAYIMNKVYELSNSKYTWMIFIPLFFPSIISNNLYALRLPLYSYVELLFAFLLILYYLRNDIIYGKKATILGVIIAILANWRSEAIYYVVLAPIFIALIFRKKVKLKYICIILIISSSLTCMITSVQNLAPNNGTYFLTGIAQPLGAIIKTDFKSNSKEKDLEVINRLLPVDMLKEKEGIYAVVNLLYKNDESTNKNFNNDLKELKKTYAKLVIYNLPTFLKERFSVFFRTSGFVSDVNTSVGDSSAMFDDGYIYSGFKQGEYYFNEPINKFERSEMIRFLECRTFNNYYQTVGTFHIFYNVVPSIIILIILTFIGLIKKNKLYFFISILLLIRIPLIIASAPAEYFMYYLPTYLCSFVIGIIFIILRREIMCKS